MRLAIIIATLVFVIACADTDSTRRDSSEWTEAQKRKFFNDSFAFTDRNFVDRRDSLTSFEAFMNRYYTNINSANKYDDFFYAMEEEYIDTSRIDSSKHIFRILVNPSFGRPYCLRLNKYETGSELILKATNGYGGYYTGQLALQVRFQFSDSLYDNTIRALRNSNFLDMPFYDSKCSVGFDGEEWMFELLDGGRYNILYRRSPQYCGDSLTNALGQIGLKIKELSKLEKILAVLNK